MWREVGNTSSSKVASAKRRRRRSSASSSAVAVGGEDGGEREGRSVGAPAPRRDLCLRRCSSTCASSRHSCRWETWGALRLWLRLLRIAGRSIPHLGAKRVPHRRDLIAPAMMSSTVKCRVNRIHQLKKYLCCWRIASRSLILV